MSENVTTLKSRSLELIHCIDPPPMTSIVNIGLSRTFSERNVDFSRKSQKFPTPMYFMPQLTGSPWNWVSARGVKKLE